VPEGEQRHHPGREIVIRRNDEGQRLREVRRAEQRDLCGVRVREQ
jgi:hypothetical protein